MMEAAKGPGFPGAIRWHIHTNGLLEWLDDERVIP